MNGIHPRELQIYRNRRGQEPFTKWLTSLSDKITRKRIQTRLSRVEAGNFGDCKKIAPGVFELRLRIGYRIYFGAVGDTIILLLGGGDKSSQQKDIQNAKLCWKEYLENRNEKI